MRLRKEWIGNVKQSCVWLLFACCLSRVPMAAEQLPLLGLARVSIRVSDLNKARALYSGVAGFEEAFDAHDANGAVTAAYFKINDLQFIEIEPGLTPKDVRPMVGFAIRTDQLKKLRRMLSARGLNPGKIRIDADGCAGFYVTGLPGQDLGFVEFVQYGAKSLAERTRGQYLGLHRLSTHLEHIGIITTNFDAAFHFYVDTLGFQENYRRVTTDRSHVVLDHIAMPGESKDLVELFYPAEPHETLKRKHAGSMAHLAFTVPDDDAVVSLAQLRDPRAHLGAPGYGLDNRWNFNLFDPDGTRIEFMQVVDPAHPTPAIAVTPKDWRQPKRTLGSFEGQSDIGSPPLSGSVSFDPVASQYTVSGAGANMWGTKDEFHFLWRHVTGDFSLTATVCFPKQEPPSHRKAALMVRQGLQDDAPYVDAVVHGSGLTELQFREKAGGLTHAIRFPIDGPVQLRLERKGAWFIMYAAKAGEPLEELGAYQLKLGNPDYVGLAVCSHNAAHIENAVFSDVSLQEIPRNAAKSK